jgi:hypothetical protein
VLGRRGLVPARRRGDGRRTLSIRLLLLLMLLLMLLRRGLVVLLLGWVVTAWWPREVLLLRGVPALRRWGELLPWRRRGLILSWWASWWTSWWTSWRTSIGHLVLLLGRGSVPTPRRALRLLRLASLLFLIGTLLRFFLCLLLRVPLLVPPPRLVADAAVGARSVHEPARTNGTWLSSSPGSWIALGWWLRRGRVSHGLVAECKRRVTCRRPTEVCHDQRREEARYTKGR